MTEVILAFNIVHFVFQFQDIGSVADCMTRSKEMANIMDLVRLHVVVQL